MELIKPLLPQYHTRAMKRTLFEKFGRVTKAIKPAILRAFYREVSGDCSASSNAVEAEIDKRVQLVLEMEPENPNTIVVEAAILAQVKAFQAILPLHRPFGCQIFRPTSAVEAQT